MQNPFLRQGETPEQAKAEVDEGLLLDVADVFNRMANIGFAMSGLVKVGITMETDPSPDFPFAMLQAELTFLRTAIAPELLHMKKERNI